MKKLKLLLYWFWQLTWGGIVTWIGAIMTLGLMLVGYKPQRYGPCVYTAVGSNWGGFEMGAFFFCDNSPSDDTKSHEYGHSLQTLILGPLMPFIVSIPSAIRYWYREYLYRVKKIKYSDMPDYDSMWFEGWATKWGQKYNNLFK